MPNPDGKQIPFLAGICCSGNVADGKKLAAREFADPFWGAQAPPGRGRYEARHRTGGFLGNAYAPFRTDWRSKSRPTWRPSIEALHDRSFCECHRLADLAGDVGVHDVRPPSNGCRPPVYHSGDRDAT